MAEQAQVIAGWYLAPKLRQALGRDLLSTRTLLQNLTKHSRELYKLSEDVSLTLEVLLGFIRHTEPGVLDKASDFDLHILGRTLHDLSLVADRFLIITTPHTGRNSEHVRDTTISLLIEAARSAGLDDLTISRGTAEIPEPHLKGRTGQFLKGFFAFVAPERSEASLTPVIERVRRRMKA